MIWRLTYCNKKGVEARIDIIKGNRTPVEVVQGSGQPFTLAYKLDKNDKSGHIMTSSADIEIFETETFNIDDLKTSNETELKVEYFEDNILTWSGFILPDFFSREIGSPNIVRMTASDRLTALKGVTLSDLPSRISLRSLIELCLAQTGLSLGLVSQIQINQGSTNILDSEVLSQRLTDVRGRSINCHDILMSIMVGTNSTIRQRAGQWQVYNKLEHELRTPTIFFDKVERGAIRTIQPVASIVGVYNEFGGNKMYPENYDFSDGLIGWTAVNGFVAGLNNKEVIGYTGGVSNFVPIYGDTVDTNSVTNRNASFSTSSSPYLKSENIGVSYPDNDSVNITVEVNATGVGSFITNSFVEFAIIATNTVTSKTLSLSNAGIFETMDANAPHLHRIKFPTVTSFYNASTGSLQVEGALIAGDENSGDYDVHVRIYGSGESRTSFINSATIKFSVGGDSPKGNLYKTAQGSNYTKLHDVETVIFGDYIRGGINGHFYYYPIDDTSNLYLPSGELSSPIWKTFFDTTERPLLHHVSRQKSRLFSVAHDILKANINVESFDPLAVFQDCKGGKYVVVSASFDFLRSEVDVELEQIAYDNTILKRDFIYSYFGEGEDTIKSIGGIAGGSGGTSGGGMTSEQLEMLTNLADWWRLDAENDAIYSLKSVYSLKGVSALGLGSSGGGGGGDFDRLDDWVDYNETKANWVLSALLGYDLHTRVNDLEADGGASNIEIAITGSGNALTDVSKSGNTLTFAKSSTFALASHTHTIAQITGLQGALDLKASQSYIDTAINGIEIGGRNLLRNAEEEVSNDSTKIYGFDGSVLRPYIGKSVIISLDAKWNQVDNNKNFDFYFRGSGIINPTSGSIELTSEYKRYYHVWEITEEIANSIHVYVRSNVSISGNDGSANIAVRGVKVELGNIPTDWSPAPEDVQAEINLVQTNLNTHASNSVTDVKHLTDAQLAYLNDLIGWWKVDASGNLYTEKNLYSTKGVSALGLGSGGGSGGGGVDMLDSWANYTAVKANYYVPASLLVPFRNDTLSRLDSLESGLATSIVTTGSGNAITSLTKSGSVITATKGLSFALSTHSHTIAQITGLQGALDLKATQSDINTAIDGIEIGGRNLLPSNIWENGHILVSSGEDSDVSRNERLRTFEFIPIENTSHYTLSWGTNSLRTVIIYEFDSEEQWIRTNAGVYDFDKTPNPFTFQTHQDSSFLKVVVDSVGFGNISPSEFQALRVKLEKGNKATDWTPAPEDVDAKITLVQTNLNTHASNSVTDVKHLTDAQLAYLNDLIGWWKVDSSGNLYTEKNLYSTKGVSALGVGDSSGGGGGGGGVDMLDSWANYTVAKADYYVPASLLVPFRNDTLDRLNAIEGGSASAIATTGTGNAITSVSKVGNLLTFNKGLEFSLSTHTHTIAQVTGLQGALDGKQPTISTGTTSQYYRGDKTWQTLNTSVVSEGTNLYFTNARAKAYGDTLYSLLGHTHTIAQITGLQGALDLKTTQSDIDTAIDAIEIGGRNYLLDSSFQSGTQGGYAAVFGTSLSVSNNILKSTETVGGRAATRLERSIFLSNTGTFTYSIKIKGTTVASSFEFRNVIGFNYTPKSYDITGDWQILNITFENETAGDKIIRVYFPYADVGDFVEVDWDALVIGNKPMLDWSPAPEDQVSDWNITDETLFSYIKNKPTQLSQFIDNIGVGTHIANKANPHNVTTSQIGAVDLTTNQTIGGVKNFTSPLDTGSVLRVSGTSGYSQGIRLKGYSNLASIWFNAPSDSGYDAGMFGITHTKETGLIFRGGNTSASDLMCILDNGNVGIGTTNPLYKLDVAGTGRFTGNVTASAGINTPKVDFGNGFTIEPSGTELVFKYNGVIKQRMLSNGTILAVGGITALTTT